MTPAAAQLPELPNFSITDPLPDGVTMVLEASAGTGKTHTIASLATRYLAEGVTRLEDMMLVTFGRVATQELRDRVRLRLVQVERALADPPTAAASDDEVVRLLATGGNHEVGARRNRLAAALASFDEATIATTHSFCLQMLAGLGVAADSESGAALLDNSSDLLRQVTDDEYLRRYARVKRRPFDAVTAHRLAAEAVEIPDASLEPADAAPDTPVRERVEFATDVRAAFDLRKRRAGRLDFDDLQLRLQEALAHPVRGDAARQLLRSAYRVVLVDEFQDTDPVQWNILRLAFHTHSTLVLIGDPKQAIYAFRGADVFTYLAAAGSADRQATLGTNWRSDASLVRALDHLWGGLSLGDKRIRVRAIEAQHGGSRFRLPGRPAPLRIRRLSRQQAVQNPSGLCRAESARAAIARDLAAEVVELLQSGATLEHLGTVTPIEPSDIAVLVHQNDQGVLIRDALRQLDVPVVLTGNASVFDSEAAAHWLTLLDALESPNRTAKVRAAALTPFLGWTADRLAEADAAEIDALVDRLRDWADRFAAGGVAALLESVTVTGGIAARVLARPDGDRLLTDIRHVAHALHAVSRSEHLGPSALLEWLRWRIDESGKEAAEELSRRLSSEDAAVQVITVHRSKGLEFGAVFVPFAWNRHVRDDPDPLRLHDNAGRQVLDVGGPGGPGYGQRQVVHWTEAFGEDLRLMYVAFTRARSLLVTWWAPTANTPCSPLSRVLFGAAGPDGEVPTRVRIGEDAEIAERLDGIAARSGGLIAIEQADPKRQPSFRGATGPEPELAARIFGRTLDTDWRRTSYSGLTAAAHAAHYEALELADSGNGVTTGGRADQRDAVDRAGGTEPEDPGTVDEPAVPQGLSVTVDAVGPAGDGSRDPTEEALRAVPSPMEQFPGGTTFGTVVHEVLEYLDTGAADLPAELLAHCRRVLGAGDPRGADAADGGLDGDQLAVALGQVLATPLGPMAGNIALAGVPISDRLAEMTFELPLAGGDDPHAESRLGDLADVLARQLPADDQLAGYPDLLRDELLAGQPLRGYLNGSLDMVLRVRGADATPRYLVVDYKTNRLGTAGQPLSAWDYRPQALATAMMQAHYPLQALLYAVALHRYLRWRQPGYRPDVHLGGALYLFVRGMSGPGTPTVGGTPCGVFGWKPSAQLVMEASAVLAGAFDSTVPHLEGRRR